MQTNDVTSFIYNRFGTEIKLASSLYPIICFQYFIVDSKRGRKKSCLNKEKLFINSLN